MGWEPWEGPYVGVPKAPNDFIPVLLSTENYVLCLHLTTILSSLQCNSLELPAAD